MDLKNKQSRLSRKQNDGVWMDVIDYGAGEILGEAEGKPVRLRVAGPLSDRAKTFLKSFRDRTVQRFQRSGRAPAGDSEFTEENLQLAVTLTLDWENVEWEGEILECTPTNVRMVYEQVDWIRSQVTAFINDASNYADTEEEASALAAEVSDSGLPLEETAAEHLAATEKK